jgi:hypothetical protein
MTVIRQLLARVYRKARTIPLANRIVDKFFREYYRLPFPPTHYYSPLPDLPSVKRNLSRWYKQSQSPGIDWNLPGQFRLAEHLAPYAGETQSLPHFAQVTLDGYGPGYGEVEAHLLYMILRHFKPTQYIEVGSGVSTFYALSALRANRERDGVNSNMTCIEPYPNQKLRKLATGHGVRLRECEVQDSGLGVFQELSANDVLFIDSSHVSKKDSDVEFLYLEVLPRLQNGVVLHIHDMPFPMPAIPLEHPLFETYLFWNEAALVKAFLLFNSAFQVIQCQSQLHHVKPEVLKKLVPIYDPKTHFPSSLWLSRAMP